MSITLVKKAIRKYCQNLLTAKYPTYFTSNNVIWANTWDDKDPTSLSVDRTECFLSVFSDEAYGFGVDREFYESLQTDDKYYTKQVEIREITVNIGVSSMLKEGVLTGLEAQNLANEAVAYIRRNLKTLASSNYFLYNNTYFTPIHVISNEISGIQDASEFEETRNRFTYQFTCKFRFDEVGEVETNLANGGNVELIGTDIDIDFDIID